MKADVFCAWGDGPDVGINYERTEQEASAYSARERFWFVDLTATEARAMAARLISCAEHAEQLDNDYKAFVEHHHGLEASGEDSGNRVVDPPSPDLVRDP